MAAADPLEVFNRVKRWFDRVNRGKIDQQEFWVSDGRCAIMKGRFFGLAY
jgi:hypothetical protein